MKRTLSLLLAFVMVLGLAACGGNTAQETTAAATAASEEAGIYTPGTYTGTAAGKNGDVKVEVTFSANAIDSVKVVEHSETAGISDGAIENIPTAIVENQSLAVDTVSGATITSDAILKAVADAVAQAGGDVEALKNAAAPAGEKEAKELSADVIVVGGGGAGMAAATRLAQLGKSVILVEKSGFLGGAISVSGGNQVVMGSQLQIDNGVADDSVESMVADFEADGANKNNKEIPDPVCRERGRYHRLAGCQLRHHLRRGPAPAGRVQPQPGAGLHRRRRGFCRGYAQGCGGSRCSGAAEYQGRVPDSPITAL